MPPMPLIECATGICSFSASASSSSVARAYFTPWPIRITGRSAASSMSTAFTTPSGSAPQRDEMLALHSCGLRRLFGGGLLEHVERHVEHDRTGTSGDHRLPGLPHHHRHLLAAGRLIHPFADAADRGGEVGLIVAMQFLECAAAELAGRHVAGDGEERHRVEIGGGERDRQVHRAGAARREGRNRLALHAVVNVRHEAADAFVVHRDGLDLALALEQRVDELDVAVAAQAEGVGHLLRIR